MELFNRLTITKLLEIRNVAMDVAHAILCSWPKVIMRFKLQSMVVIVLLATLFFTALISTTFRYQNTVQSAEFVEQWFMKSIITRFKSIQTFGIVNNANVLSA